MTRKKINWGYKIWGFILFFLFYILKILFSNREKSTNTQQKEREGRKEGRRRGIIVLHNFISCLLKKPIRDKVKLYVEVHLFCSMFYLSALDQKSVNNI